MKIHTHPNKAPKNPFCAVAFFSASAIKAIAFCSLSPIAQKLIRCNFNANLIFQ